MGRPAARRGDLHVCPMPYHGVTPIVQGSPDVITSHSPQARVGDSTACGASIILASRTVLVNHRFAARLGDKTSHGGTIITGAFNVLIG